MRDFFLKDIWFLNIISFWANTFSLHLRMRSPPRWMKICRPSKIRSLGNGKKLLKPKFGEYCGWSTNWKATRPFSHFLTFLNAHYQLIWYNYVDIQLFKIWDMVNTFSYKTYWKWVELKMNRALSLVYSPTYIVKCHYTEYLTQ